MGESGFVDTETLAAALWAHGVHVLRTTATTAPVVALMSPAEVVVGLVQHPQARLRDAAPALIVAKAPDAPLMRSAGERLQGTNGERFQTLYTVAACLQRQWWTRLRLSLPGTPRLDDSYSAGLGLPPVDERHGRICLASIDPALAASCGETFRIFLEELEREQRFAAAPSGGA